MFAQKFEATPFLVGSFFLLPEMMRLASLWAQKLFSFK